MITHARTYAPLAVNILAACSVVAARHGAEVVRDGVKIVITLGLGASDVWRHAEPVRKVNLSRARLSNHNHV